MPEMIQRGPSDRLRLAAVALVCSAGATAGCAAAGAAGSAAEPTVLVIAAEAPEPPRPPSTVFRCDEGKRFEVAGRSYCGYEEPSSWQAAERRCVDNGGHLFSLDTAATSAALRGALRSPLEAGRGVWIGLSEEHGAWTWVTGEPLQSPSWDRGEPNNFGGAEQCAEWLAAGGNWNDTRCEQKQGYLCQAKPAGGNLKCPGYIFWIGTTAYCLTEKLRLSWESAGLACGMHGGTLAVLRTPDENRLLREAMAARFNAKQLWMGLTDHHHEGTWSWVSRATGDFTAWHDGEPNDYRGEDCGELYADSWTWNDFDCRAQLPSVCEGPPP